MTHGYDTVDYAVLWNVSQREIPKLILAIDELLNGASESG